MARSNEENEARRCGWDKQSWWRVRGLKIERNTSAAPSWHNLLSTHRNTRTHTLVRPQSPETWLREQSYRSVGWQARMDEQAGLQEHQRTASVPPNPHATPPNHPRQSQESAGATGKKAGAATLRLQRSSRGSNSNWRARVVWSNQCTVLCVFRRAPKTGLSAHLVHTREGAGKVVAIPWTQLDGVLVPLNCLYLPFLPPSHTHKHTRTLPMFAGAWWKRLSADGCLLGPRVLEGGLWGHRWDRLCIWDTNSVCGKGDGTKKLTQSSCYADCALF